MAEIELEREIKHRQKRIWSKIYIYLVEIYHDDKYSYLF